MSLENSFCKTVRYQLSRMIFRYTQNSEISAYQNNFRYALKKK